jgi:hypothetical protein
MADQLYKKRKGKRHQREEAKKEIMPFRYLIVCEGSQTEPNYFNGIKSIINQKFGNKISIKNISADRITVDGTGRNTEDLVRYAIEKRKLSDIPYGHVWCVFDKDDFTDAQFNSAIQMCKANGIGAAWSNESIELWFLLHFEYLNTGMSRVQYNKKLDKYFKFHDINHGKYEKNLEDIYAILTHYGNLDDAIRYAKKLDSQFDDSISPANAKPSSK